MQRTQNFFSHSFDLALDANTFFRFLCGKENILCSIAALKRDIFNVIHSYFLVKSHIFPFHFFTWILLFSSLYCQCALTFIVIVAIEIHTFISFDDEEKSKYKINFVVNV